MTNSLKEKEIEVVELQTQLQKQDEDLKSLKAEKKQEIADQKMNDFAQNIAKSGGNIQNKDF